MSMSGRSRESMPLDLVCVGMATAMPLRAAQKDLSLASGARLVLRLSLDLKLPTDLKR